jgi:hypothetical protein
MSDPQKQPVKDLNISYSTYVLFVVVILMLSYVAWLGLSNSTLGAMNHFLLICLMALAISILYVGVQIGRLVDKL